MRRRLCCNPAEQRSRAEMRAGVSACVRKEEDLLFLECQACTRWRNSAIRRAKGQRTITVPR